LFWPVFAHRVVVALRVGTCVGNPAVVFLCAEKTNHLLGLSVWMVARTCRQFSGRL
jgi:hypothetical protein